MDSDFPSSRSLCSCISRRKAPLCQSLRIRRLVAAFQRLSTSVKWATGDSAWATLWHSDFLLYPAETVLPDPAQYLWSETRTAWFPCGLHRQCPLRASASQSAIQVFAATSFTSGRGGKLFCLFASPMPVWVCHESTCRHSCPVCRPAW